MKKFFKGFVYAAHGIWLVSYERNMRVHLIVAWAVIVAGIYFQLRSTEWATLLISFALVMTAESFNTAIEYCINLIRDDCHVPYANPKLGKAKDIAAGAVLISAMISAAIGVLVFTPHIMKLMSLLF